LFPPSELDAVLKEVVEKPGRLTALFLTLNLIFCILTPEGLLPDS